MAAVFTEMISRSGNLQNVPFQGFVSWPSGSQWSELIYPTPSHNGPLFYGDSGWYWSIVVNGYQKVPSAFGTANWAFFPLYPELVALFGSNPWSGVLISNLSTLLAVLILQEVLTNKYNSNLGYRAAVLMLYFPFSYHLSVFRPEGLLLLLIVLTYFFAVKHRWLLAGLCGFLAALTKPDGLSTAFLISYMYLLSINFQWRRIRFGSVATLGPFAGVTLFSLYLWIVTGDPFAWFHIRSAWDQALRFPGAAISAYLQHPLFIDTGGWNLAGINWLVMIVSLITASYLLARSFHKRDREELGLGVFSILYVLAVMTVAGSVNFGRYVLPIFPLFLVWGELLDRHSLFEVVLVMFAGLLALFGCWIGLGLEAVMV